ncbi:MAG TPA: heme-binding domain-containing protein [Candidatus Saccharimonadales bacterium]|nr:heme-binding domain-containing protein [Candidatus Saccharimonadales bacterium]
MNIESLHWLKWCFIGAVALFAALQIANPSHTNPPVKTDFLTVMDPPPKITAMFRSACYDCHSNETRWPWYSYVAPVSWQVAQDVRGGRKHVNLSEWPEDKPDLARKKLKDMSDEIDDDDMPLGKYTLIHADARLTEAQRNELTQWLDAQADLLKSKAGSQ